MAPSSKMEPKEKSATRRDRRPAKKRYQPKLETKKIKKNDSSNEKSVASYLNEKCLLLSDDTSMATKKPPPWYAGTPTQNDLMDETIPTKKSTDSFSFKDHCPGGLDTDWLTTMNSSLPFKTDLVPSPPPFVRSVAQVLSLSIHRCSDHYPHKMKSDCTTDLSISPVSQSAGLLSGCSLSHEKPFFWDDRRLSLRDDATKLAASPSPCSLASSPEFYMGRMPTAATDMPPSTLNRAENPAETTFIPASLLSGKVVPTQFGLAIVIVPSADVSTKEYNNSLLHMRSTHNKRWTQWEDDLLKHAVSHHQPPYPWLDISQNFFPSQRSANQVRRQLLHITKYF
jgi:Myb-like DNA-binding domain